MIEAQRHTAILELLDRNRLLTVKDIISNFNISPATARRDILKLEELGKVKKVRNGIKATSQKGTHWSPLNIHSAYNVDEKARIAKKAASICKNGESIVINCGSTAFLLGQEICGRDIQIITNYFPLMSYLVAENHDGLVIVGGQYHRKRCLTISPDQESTTYYAGNYMFTSGTGLTSEGLYKIDLLSSMAEKNMISQVDKLAVLVDSSKVGQRRGMLFASNEQIDIVITGKEANAKIIAELREQGIQVLLV